MNTEIIYTEENKVSINNIQYQVEKNEFIFQPHIEYTNLRIHSNVGIYERLVSLIQEINFSCSSIQRMVSIDTTHGGWIPLQCSIFMKVQCSNTNKKHRFNIDINKKEFDTNLTEIPFKWTSNTLFYVEDTTNLLPLFSNITTHNIILITCTPPTHFSGLPNVWHLSNTKYYIYFSNFFLIPLKHHFSLFLSTSISTSSLQLLNNNIDDNNIDDNIFIKELTYDNLLHLCCIVRNGGEQFREMLQTNLPYIDRWTILDTGSTDNTISIIKEVLEGTKEGKLYEEPFINFKDSRNRCIELATTNQPFCKYIIMLDDTYYIKSGNNGNLRNFLQIVRGDQFSQSFSIMINSNDMQYASNRIIRSDYPHLRYIHKIHEVITDKDNIQIIIPLQHGYIYDGRFSYMEERTINRKQQDLDVLFEELAENSMNPRTYYYLGQTYNLLGNFQKAYEYFIKRGYEFKNSGFIQERIDAIFEAARIAQFQLKLPSTTFLPLYEKAYQLDDSRPDSLYFLGIYYYYYEYNPEKTYSYWCEAFKNGFPIESQYSLRPTISYYFLPKLLIPLCYQMHNYILGEKVCSYFLQNIQLGIITQSIIKEIDEYNNTVETINNWYHIFNKLNQPLLLKSLFFNITQNSNLPHFIFIADGGFNTWSGTNITTNGVGGSETYIIELAKHIQKLGHFQVSVFCNCDNNGEICNDVAYYPLSTYKTFITTYQIHTCIISRFSEYIPMSYESNIQQIYFVLHDLLPSGNIIPINPKLKRILCLTEWHCSYFTERFPVLASITSSFSYGIDQSTFGNNNLSLSISNNKIPFRFIYSSFPNRGLLPLLQMWPRIVAQYPTATLDIFSDINGEWVNKMFLTEMNILREILASNTLKGINYYGWVNKSRLAQGWNEAQFWFYPCTFMETFCLTALEAAISKTCAITNGLAALENSVGDRGIIISGSVNTDEWKERALNTLFSFMNNPYLQAQLIEKNYKWAQNLSWKNQASLLQHNILTDI